MILQKRAWSPLSRATATVFFAVSVSGCSYLEQAQDNAPMTSVLEVNRAQTMNPAASENRKVVAGLNGQAGQNVADAYVKSFTPKDAGGANDLFLGLQGVGGGQ